MLHCEPFIKCITKIDEIDDAEDLDLVMLLCNLLEYSSNCSDTAGRLWFYSKDEATNLNADIGNYVPFKSFMYKTKLIRETEAQSVPNNNNGILKNARIAVPLKYPSNFWRSFEMSLINCKVVLKLKWTKYCVLAETGVENADTNSNNIIFIIKDTKLYVPVVTLSAEDNQKLPKLLSKGFERSGYCNEYKTKSENKYMPNV